jgi:hypothetical protein
MFIYVKEVFPKNRSFGKNFLHRMDPARRNSGRLDPGLDKVYHAQAG